MTRKRLALASISLIALAALHASDARALPTGTVSPGLASTLDLGAVAPGQTLTLSLTLALHNEAELDQRIDAIYDRASPLFRHFLTRTELARYAPSEAEYEAVRAQLLADGFTVAAEDETRLSLRVSAPAATVARVFHTQLRQVSVGGRTSIAHVTDATLSGPAAALVAGVVGLDRHAVHPMRVVAKDPTTGMPLFDRPLTQALKTDAASKFTTIALGPVQTFTATSSDGTTKLTATGQVYDPSGLPVVFTPKQLQAYYGLTELGELGYDGRGQTVVLVEGYGYGAALSDLNTFSAMFGLPPMNANTLRTIYPEGKPAAPNAGDLTGWTGEIALDIETVHALAPGAHILIVASNGQDNEDQIASLAYIVSHDLPKIVSNSWENDTDLIAGNAERQAFDQVLKVGAAMGYAFQFSSGDGGDGGLGTPVGAPGIPSNSPYVTAVGGTSLLNNDAAGTGFTPTGWGDQLTALSDFNGNPGYPPPFILSVGGAGGGISVTEPKPAWQKSLPGKTRRVPDIAALADPYTGVPVISTVGGQQSLEAGVGGTSLAAPLVSAIWAVSQQYAHRTLGQIAPVVSQLAPGEITDVIPNPPQSAADVKGSIATKGQPTVDFTSEDIFALVDKQHQQVVSAFAPTLGGGQQITVFAFGSNGSLTIGNGWDFTTGWGEPNGLPFIVAITH